MRTEGVGRTLSLKSPPASTSASFVPSGEKEGIITPSLPVSTRSSRPLVGMTSPVAVVASEMYFDPGTKALLTRSARPPKTTYLPSGVSAELAPDFVVWLLSVPSGRLNEAHARSPVQLLYGATEGADGSSIVATSVVPSALTEWHPMQRPWFS